MAAATKRKPVANKTATLPRELTVRLKFNGNTYVAQRSGQSASCTWSDAQAVRRLAAKLGFKRDFDVQLVGPDPRGGSFWKIVQVGATA